MADRDELRTDQVYKGDVWFTGTATFEHAVHLLDGVEIDAASILTGVLTHEVGGLEADVSAFNGLVKISAGATSAVTLTAFGASLLDDADAAAARTTLGLAAIAASGSWSDLSGAPTTLAGYGITDAASDAELSTHAGLTSGVHGISAFAATFLDDADAASVRTTLGLAAIAASGSWSDLSGTPTTLAGYGITDAASDAELTTHAGLTSGVHGITAFGASITAAANAGAVRTLLGLDALAVSGDWTDLNGVPAAIDAIDGLTPAADRVAYYTGASSAALTTLTSLARSLLAQTSEAAMRNVLDLEAIAASGSYSDLVSIPAAIDAIDGLTPAANKLAYYISGSGAALTDLTGFGRNLIDDADAAAGRSTLGLGSLATLSTVGTSQLTDDAVTYAKIQDVSATDRLLGRSTAGAGVIEEITCTAAGRAILDDADAASQRATLGLGSSDLVQVGGLGVGVAATATYRVYVVGDGSNLTARFDSGGALGATFEFRRTTATSSAGDTVGVFDAYNGATRVGQFGYTSDGATDSGRFEAIVKPTGGGLAYGFICDSAANFLLGHNSKPSAGSKSMVFGDAGGDPTLTGNTAATFGKDVSGTVEVFVMDEAGNVTQLSEHATDGPAWLYDGGPMPERVSRVANVYAGRIEWVNRSRMERLLELRLNGDPIPGGAARKFRHSETYAEYNARMGYLADDPRRHVRADWDAVQEAAERLREAEIADWEARKAQADAAGRPMREPRPQPHVKRPKPAWLKAG